MINKFHKIHEFQQDRVIEFYLNNTGSSKVKRKELKLIKKDLLDDFKIYKTLGQLGKLHNISRHISTISDENKTTLNLLYKSYLPKTGMRKKVFSTSLICPACQKGYATERSSLDHFLPSSIFPNFYVYPLNLIPTCGDCNRIKNDELPSSHLDNLPHPYFDGFLFKNHWLEIEVYNRKPLNFTFKIPNNLSKKNRLKIINHILAYDLEDTLFTHVDSIFVDVDEDFKEIYDSKGGANLKKYIGSLRKTAFVENHKNKFLPINLEYALFDALYSSDWFCNSYYS
ncbi:HNH endonuclease signature motif containing protein [Vibrio tasmaniensis]|uniref:HNH endonuclease signature motif containing protein n=1 Tax=Vibrio tasmaniensis TaxID=212663 RepID=UPI00111B184C|nr:HNH endonuclease signature motif containing protein [Vibrio tasmaniensis]